MAQTAETAASDVARTPEEIVRAAFDAISKHDLDALGPVYAEDVVEDLVPIGVLRGRSAVVAFFAELFAALPDLEMQLVRVVTDGGERVVAEWRITGTFDGGPFQGIDPTGSRIDIRGLDLFEVREGEVASNTAYYDGAEFLRQVGMMPAQDSTAERALKGAFNAVTKVRRTIGEKVGG